MISQKAKSQREAVCTSCKVFLSLCFLGHNVGSLFHMADDLGRAMESLVSVMTDEEGAE